jgi:Na+-transporting NADH:ubiquinone oxidoreductase subunit C
MSKQVDEKTEISEIEENDAMIDSTEKQKTGFWALPNDSIVKTFGVALLLCLFCSIIVSGAATALKPKQVKNRQLDVQKNILSVAGLTDSSVSIEERFKKVEIRIVDMATGDYTDAVENVQTYDQRKASKDPAQSISLTNEQDIAQVGRRAKYGKVYLLRDGESLNKVIIPIKGYGLWSTLYGFVALKSDGNTVSDVTFYEHNETPGLGGEIENREWQKVWQGKRVLNDAGEPAFTVVKGVASPQNIHDVDGLAGATLTASGVMNLVRFWVGENGFGPYLKKLAATAGAN